MDGGKAIRSQGASSPHCPASPLKLYQQTWSLLCEQSKFFLPALESPHELRQI